MFKYSGSAMAPKELSMQTFRPLLARLVQTPEYFSANDLKEALNHLFTPDLLDPTQIGAFLVALHIHRVERRPESLSAAAAVLRERALKPAIEDLDKDFTVDVVGTGGDGFNLFNVSTAAGIAAAGAGARVIKVCCHATISTPCADIKHSMGVGLHRRLRVQLIFLSRSIAFLLPHHLERLSRSGVFPSPSFLHLITTAHWQRSHHTEKHYHAALCLTSWVLSLIPQALVEWSLESLKKSSAILLHNRFMRVAWNVLLSSVVMRR